MDPTTKTFKLTKAKLTDQKVLDACGLDDPTELPFRRSF